MQFWVRRPIIFGLVFHCGQSNVSSEGFFSSQSPRTQSRWCYKISPPGYQKSSRRELSRQGASPNARLSAPQNLATPRGLQLLTHPVHQRIPLPFRRRHVRPRISRSQALRLHRQVQLLVPPPHSRLRTAEDSTKMAVDRCRCGAHEPQDCDYCGPDQPIDALGDGRPRVNFEGTARLSVGGLLGTIVAAGENGAIVALSASHAPASALWEE